MFLYILAIIVGFALLIWSADQFVDGATAIANYFRVPTLVVGMVVIGFGTSAPEMLVSGTAAYNGNAGLGIGNAIGSNIANIALVLGVTAMVRRLPVESNIIRREMPILLVAQIVAFFFLYSGELSRWDGIALLTGLGLILYWMVSNVNKQSHSSETLIHDIQKNIESKEKNSQDDAPMYWALVGLLLLLASSHLLVWGSTHMAQLLGINDLLIGLTIVAIGTSLPELATSITSALKGETDLAIGNIVGSNIFNTLGVLAIPALIAPGFPPSAAVYRDVPVMIGLTVLLLIFARGYFQKHVLTWWKGSLLLGCYIGYMITLYYDLNSNTECTTWLCL